MGKRVSSETSASPSKKKSKEADNEDSTQRTTDSFEVKKTTTDGRDAAIKICSWNVAGLRAWVKKNGLDYVQKECPDIICLQETKCEEKDLPPEVIRLRRGNKLTKDNDNEFYMYWCIGEQKGYSGVALWSKTKPLKVTNGMGITEHDKEGRLITAEYDKYYVVTSYVPNSGKKLVRLDYRRTWNTAMKEYLNTLNEKKPVIFCGDLNVAHNEIDIANPKSNKRNAGFTDEERSDFSDLLAEGYFDSYRHLNPDKTGAYTYWTYMGNARAKNVGWRLDYFVLSSALQEHLCDNVIKPSITGSDHCPIVLTLAEV